jgi:moderate conductance mechanosensitive channel
VSLAGQTVTVMLGGDHVRLGRVDDGDPARRRYELVCDLANHYADGMRQELDVTAGDGSATVEPSRRRSVLRGWSRSPARWRSRVGRATEILQQLGADAYADPELRSLLLDTPTVMGVETIEVDEFRIRVVARTLPGKQFAVGRGLADGQ